MTVPRPLFIGGGIAGLALLVVWMIPPTTPKARPASALPHRTRSAPSPALRVPTGETGTERPPTAPPLPTDGSFAAHQDAPEPRQAYERRQVPSPERNEDRSFDQYALADPQEEFDRGYRWAERWQAEDPRECRRWADTPREDGCLAFLQDQEDRGGMDEAEEE